MRHLIVTASDLRYGDFLINSWVKSFQENVNTKNIDILILDYGMSSEQVKTLKEKNVLVKKCVRDGHPVILRLRDMADFLSHHKYDQVMSTDSGDIIFQDDISSVFETDKDTFRASCERGSFMSYNTALIKYSNMSDSAFFEKEVSEKIIRMLKGKLAVNVGVFVGPAKKIQKLAEESYNMIKNKNAFGPDTPSINYILYRDGFKVLNEKYNYSLLTSVAGFYIRDSVFYFKDGTKIPIVHNVGGASFFRQVRDFGYGKGHNKLKYFSYYSLKAIRMVKLWLFRLVGKKD